MDDIRVRLGPALLPLLLCSCGSDPSGPGDAGTDAPAEPAGCLDVDGDGAGIGTDCRASDCDDTDPDTDDECGQDCPSHGTRKGCPCTTGTVSACYRGPAGSANVGECHPGVQRCEDGVLGECTGQVLPADEICDEADQDCDGEIDDGVLSECGSCAPCQSSCAGPDEGCDDWQEGEASRSVVETTEGYLTLGATASTLHVIWPSSADTGQILRVDTETRQVLGAYWTGTGHDGGWSTDSPSRTAVDDEGNVVIANRRGDWEEGGDSTSSITKVAADPASCPDTNGNGVVDTSSGWDDVLPFEEDNRWDDECILWHTMLPGGGARPVVIESSIPLDGTFSQLGWVGLYDNQRFYQFDHETGELTGEEVSTAGLWPYGGAIDREGWVWVAGGHETNVGRFDTADPDGSWELITVPGTWDIARVIVDENDVPWFTGDDLWRYDRDTEEFSRANLNTSSGALASDGEGSIWVATYSEAEHVFRVSNDEEMEWHQVPTPGTITFGMAVDFEGQAWTFGYSNDWNEESSGAASVIDIDTEEAEQVLDDCDGGCLHGPYIRGDITGLQRHNALNPLGRWSRVFEGCESGDTTWRRLLVDADVPAGSRIVVSARTTDELAAIERASEVTLGVLPDDGTTLDLAGPLRDPGRHLEILIRLESVDHDSAPTLRGMQVDWTCPSVIE